MGSKQNKLQPSGNPVEAFRDISHGVVDSISQDLGKEAVNNLWDQLLGSENSKNSKETVNSLDIFEVVFFKDTQKKSEEKKAEPKEQSEKSVKSQEAPMNYFAEIAKSEVSGDKKEQQEVQMQVQQIVNELKQLASSIEIISNEVKAITVEQRVTKPGKYHLNFFEWMLAVVKSARLKVEDAGSWMGAMKGKGQKMGYWDQFEEKGTSFGLSNERSVATQVG